MRPRQNLIELFSTFLQLEAEHFSRWVADPKLRRSMQGVLAQSPQPSNSEKFWALYWHKAWLAAPTSLARWHLSAYLQEPCYWVAHKTAIGFASAQYSLSDCFQLAIARVDRVLKGFNPQQGVALKNYASVIFSNVIREILRQRQEVDICTPWALLRKLSQKQLVESLRLAGLASEAIDGYVLAWNCFKIIYVPTQARATRQLSRPDRATWEAITAFYNSERHRQLNSPGSQSNPETLEKWLTACAKAARAYLYPRVTSIHTPQPGQESGELLDDLAAQEEESLLTQIIAQEEEKSRQTQQAQITEVLVAAIAQLEPQAQQLLQLYYRQELTQQQMAQQLEMKQYTISRRLSGARQSLLTKLAQWSQQTLHITLSSDVLKAISTLLEDWLKTHYSPTEPPTQME